MSNHQATQFTGTCGHKVYNVLDFVRDCCSWTCRACAKGDPVPVTVHAVETERVCSNANCSPLPQPIENFKVVSGYTGRRSRRCRKCEAEAAKKWRGKESAA